MQLKIVAIRVVLASFQLSAQIDNSFQEKSIIRRKCILQKIIIGWMSLIKKSCFTVRSIVTEDEIAGALSEPVAETGIIASFR